MKTMILFFNLFFMLSCNNDDDFSFQSTEITFTEIGKGELFGDGDENISQSNLVINNQTDWQNLMNQMNTVNNVTNEFSETNIDFNSYILIAIFLEVKPNGWQVEVTKIEEEENNIVVSKVELESIALVQSQPFHIIKIPTTSKEIVFE